MNAAAPAVTVADAERALASMARSVALAPGSERVNALRDAAAGLRGFVVDGMLSPVAVSDRIFEVAESHGLAGDPGSEQEAEIGAIAQIVSTAQDYAVADESRTAAGDEFTQRNTISSHAAQSLASSDRMLTGIDRPHLAKKFLDAAQEALRLTDPGRPEERQQIVDDLYAMGVRHGIDVDAVQTLMAVATEAPRPGSTAQIVDEQPPAGPDEYGDTGGQWAPDSPWAPERQNSLQLVRPKDWHGVPLPPMRWLATHRIPASDATILSGDGGGGKTTVALQLAVAVERGLGDWLGTVTESGPVIFFSAEETQDEMRRRIDRFARKRGFDPSDIEDLHFHFADPDRCLLGTTAQNGAMVPTPLFSALEADALDIRPVLIVVDTIAATFGGNQNDRVHARTFVAMFRRLAQRVDCAVLLLDHPSLSGITSGTGRGGSMDWQNATRARLHLETVSDADGTTGRVLEVKKSNYGPAGEKVRLQWDDGCFVMEGSTSAATPYRAAAHQRVDDLFVRLLEERNAQGRWVTPSKAAGYAPKELATMPGADGTTATALAHAMERLLTAKRIAVEPFGPPSKQRQRLIVTPSNRLPAAE